MFKQLNLWLAALLIVVTPVTAMAQIDNSNGTTVYLPLAIADTANSSSTMQAVDGESHTNNDIVSDKGQSDSNQSTSVYLPLVIQGEDQSIPPVEEVGEQTSDLDDLFVTVDNVQAASVVQTLAERQASPTVSRARLVKIRFDQLHVTSSVQAAQTVVSASKRLALNLFDDVKLTAVLKQVVQNPSGSYSWIGTLEGINFSQVVLTLKDQSIYGTIIFPNGVYEISQIEGDTHAVYAINQSVFPDDESPDSSLTKTAIVADGEAEQVMAAESNTVMAEDGSDIAALVVYTNGARDDGNPSTTVAQDRDALVNEIENAVNSANASYSNSQINQRVRLAGTAEVNYTETYSTTIDKGNLRNGTAGLSIVQQLRRAYAADLVVMITKPGGANLCGEAFIMVPITPNFRTNALAVVVRNCLGPNLSFAHELGHLMGVRHDWFVDDTKDSPDSDNHGYVSALTLPNPFRTIMAYDDECTAGGVTCNRIPYWSNPDVITRTVPTGVRKGTSVACKQGDKANPDCDADDHRVLNKSAKTVSLFEEGNKPNVYIDRVCHIFLGTCYEDGSSSYPYDTFTEGIFHAAANGTVTIQAGSYSETLVLVTKNPRGLTLNRPITLRATGGIVTIGQ